MSNIVQHLRPDPVLDGVLATIDASWRSELRHLALVERLQDQPRALPGLHRHLSAHLGFPTLPTVEASDPLGALVRAPTAEVVATIRAVGAVLWWPAIRKAVAGPQLRALIDCLGGDLYRLVLHRGETLAAGHGPVGRALAMATDGINDDCLIAAGVALFIDALDGRDESLRRRLLMRLPRPWYLAARTDRWTYPAPTARSVLANVRAALCASPDAPPANGEPA